MSSPILQRGHSVWDYVSKFQLDIFESIAGSGLLNPSVKVAVQFSILGFSVVFWTISAAVSRAVCDD